MNVLMISLDSTLAMDKDKVIGDSQDRHILYGKYLTNLFIVVYSKREQRLTTKRLSENVVVYPTSSRKGFFVWDAYKISKRICRENKIDVITTQDPLSTGLVGYLLKRKLKIPLNVQLHGDYLNNDFWLKESILNRFLNISGNFIIRRADSIRAVSNNTRNNLVSKIGVLNEKLIVFPVFVNTDSENIGYEKQYSKFKNVVLFVGRLSREKNVETLLIAAQKVLNKSPQTLFLIVGDGQKRKDLERFSQELEIEGNVKFEGAVGYKQIRSYYQLCDILVLPSKHEGWGRVVIEALACAKPVIVSDACGVAEFVLNEECGFVFPVDRPDILVEKITYSLEHPELREKMGERGQRYVKENLDIEKNAHKYREMYEKTVELAKQNR